jgi:hypothetical protein
LNAGEGDPSGGISSDLKASSGDTPEMARDTPPIARPIDDSKDDSDPVERALARAPEAVVAAGRLDDIPAIVEELRARRLGRAGNVLVLRRR